MQLFNDHRSFYLLLSLCLNHEEIPEHDAIPQITFFLSSKEETNTQYKNEADERDFVASW